MVMTRINSGHVLSVGGLALSVGGFYSVSGASAVFFLCFVRVVGRSWRLRHRNKYMSHEGERLRRFALTATFFNFGLHICDHYFCQPPLALVLSCLQ